VREIYRERGREEDKRERRMKKGKKSVWPGEGGGKGVRREGEGIKEGPYILATSPSLRSTESSFRGEKWPQQLLSCRGRAVGGIVQESGIAGWEAGLRPFREIFLHAGCSRRKHCSRNAGESRHV
jgi:hypothetical protein